MSRKLFSIFLDKKQKGDSFEDETTGNNTFDRRISVSNSGRWKQKNKHRSKVNEDLFKHNEEAGKNNTMKTAIEDKICDKEEKVEQNATHNISDSTDEKSGEEKTKKDSRKRGSVSDDMGGPNKVTAKKSDNKTDQKKTTDVFETSL